MDSTLALPTASILILLFDGMSKRHNYNWNSRSCSYAVWNAPMLCGMHKLMHHLVLQIHDHDWHPIGDKKSIKAEVKVSVGIGHGGYTTLWWVLWRMKAIGITTSFAKAPMEFVHGVQNLWTSLPPPKIRYAALVIGTSFTIEGASLLVAIQAVKEGAVAEGMKLTDFIWRGHDPTSVSVLTEDGAAVTGLAIAVASLVAVNRTGNALYWKIF